MAKQRFERDDFFGKDLTPFEEFLAFNKLLDATAKKVADLSDAIKKSAESADPGTAKGINEINKALDQSLELQEDLKKIDSAREKSISKLNKAIKEEAESTRGLTEEQKKAEKQAKQLEKELDKLNEITSEHGVELAKVRIKQAEARKEAKRLAQAQLDQARAAEEAHASSHAMATGQQNVTGAYAAQSKQLRDLKNQYKDLVAAGQGQSKQAQELLVDIRKQDKALKELDATVGDNFRSVGDYEKALGGLSGAFAKAGRAAAAMGGALAVGGVVSRGIKSTSEGLESFGAIGEGIESGIDSALGTVSQGVINMKNSVTSEDVKEIMRFPRSFGEAWDQTKASLDLAKRAYGSFGDEVKDVGNKAADAFNSTVDLRLEVIAFNKATRATRIDIARLTGDFEEFTLISDDSTRSLTERREAGDRAFVTGNVALTKSISLLKSEVGFLEKRAAAQLKNNQTAAFQETLNELTEKQIALEDALSQRQQIRLQNIQRLSEIEADSATLRKDILLDNFDNLKTVNERIIADERRTVAERFAILDETSAKFEENNKNLINNFVELRREQEALRQGIDKTLVRLPEDVENLTENFDKLLNLDDENLVDTIQKLGFSEQISIEILDILKERRTFTQDLAEAQRDLNEASLEENNLFTERALLEDELNQLRSSGLLTEEQQSVAAQARINAEIDAIDEEIALRQSRNEKIVDLEVDRLQKEIELEKILLEEKKKADEESVKSSEDAAKERANQIRELADVSSALSNAISRKQLENIDARLDASRNEISTQQALAEQGSKTALEELQRQKRIEAEKLAERERVAQRQRRIEATIAGLKVYAAKVESGDPNPVGSTISDASTLIAALSQLQDGTEYVDSSTATRILPGGRDAYVSRLDHGERVVSREQNARIGDISNEDLATLAENHRKGLFIPFGMTKEDFKGKEISVSPLNSAVISELKSLRREVQNGNNKTLDWDAIDKVITEKVRQGNKYLEGKYKLRKFLG